MENPSTELRDHVKEIYAGAAEKKAGLCCPKAMPSDLVRHIPAEAFDHNYGCGTPVAKANISPGAIVVDLGSGVGIDTFVAAKLVGAKGRVYGIDMTDEMLAQAYKFNAQVSKNLGYDVVEFRKGLIEKIPLESNTADIVVSNCAINLALDKVKAFKEMFRVLKPGGRLFISDIVSDREVKPEDQQSKQEWAECVTGSLSLGQLLDTVKAAGFVGLHQVDESGWQELRGYHFSTLTLEAAKYVSDCNANIASLAIYLGPYAKITDDMGNEYERFKPAAIRDDVAIYLRSGANAKSFIVVQGRAKAKAKAQAKPQPAAAPARRATPCCDPTDKVAPCCENSDPKPDGSPCCDPTLLVQPPECPCAAEVNEPSVSVEVSASCCDSGPSTSGGAASSSSCCGDSSSASASSGGGCAPGACGPGGCG
jgi:SAM-dependent methyltransferase